MIKHQTDYRLQAERQRQAASKATLPNVRKIHLEAAEKFDYLADEVDRRRARRHPAFTQQIFS